MNPFRDTIVGSPWETTRVDIPEIHSRVFDKCLEGIEHVRRAGKSGGLLIHGEAGSGKTHLLRRLRTRLSLRAPSATHREECLYVWVRLQTSPGMIWRTLRRTLVEDWFRPVEGGHSQFQRILFHRLAEIRVAEGDLEHWYDYMLEEQRDGLQELMEQIAHKLHLERNTAVAFEHIAFGRHLRDLRAWLAGTSLPQAALERLDLAQDDGDDGQREDEARRVVLKLCELAGNGLPIVLSFDQVEALQAAPGDREALFAFGQLISTLHDETTNTLLISSVQSSFATELSEQARRADYERMKSLGQLSLEPLDRSQAEQLIARRLDDADIPHAVGWPLDNDEFDSLFARGFVSPRQLLTLCAERYDARQRAAASEDETPQPIRLVPESVTDPVETFLHGRWEESLEQKAATNAPENTEEIVRHGFPLLVKLVSPGTTFIQDKELPDVSLVFDAAGRRTGVSVCTQSNMISLAARLKRLLVQFTPERLSRLVLLRDSRVPLGPGAVQTRKRLAELEAGKAVSVFPSVEALAALDALRDLLSDAKSGDLACAGNTIPPATVEEWLTAHLSSNLRDLVGEIFGDATEKPEAGDSDAQAVEALNQLLAAQPCLPLQNAADALQLPVDVVAEVARRHPAHFTLLGPPPETLFRVVDATETSA